MLLVGGRSSLRPRQSQTRALGVSLVDYVNDIVVREANISPEPERRTGKDLIDACAKMLAVRVID